MLYHLGFHLFLLSPHKPYSLLLFSPADTQHLPLFLFFRQQKPANAPPPPSVLLHLHHHIHPHLILFLLIYSTRDETHQTPPLLVFQSRSHHHTSIYFNYFIHHSQEGMKPPSPENFPARSFLHPNR